MVINQYKQDNYKLLILNNVLTMNNEDNMQETQEASYSQESRGVAMNIFAVLGFVAILLAGLWATVQLVRQISNLSFDFSKPTISLPMFGDSDNLAITTDAKDLVSGESAELSWTLGKDKQGAQGSVLNFSYACKRGAYVKVADVTNGTYKAIPCNAPYPIPTTDTKLVIIPVLTDSEKMEMPYALTYTPIDDDEQSVSSTLNIVIATNNTDTPVTEEQKDGEMSTQDITPTPKAQATTTKKVVYKKIPMQTTRIVPIQLSDPNGLPDLAIKVLEMSAVDPNGKVAVRFEVANIGTKVVSGWTFTAALPTDPAYTYVSEAQGALYAGERAEMLLTFNNLKTGTNSISLIVDTSNTIIESLETNNSAAATVTK